jgi:hypothetical protein
MAKESPQVRTTSSSGMLRTWVLYEKRLPADTTRAGRGGRDGTRDGTENTLTRESEEENKGRGRGGGGGAGRGGRRRRWGCRSPFQPLAVAGNALRHLHGPHKVVERQGATRSAHQIRVRRGAIVIDLLLCWLQAGLQKAGEGWGRPHRDVRAKMLSPFPAATRAGRGGPPCPALPCPAHG